MTWASLLAYGWIAPLAYLLGSIPFGFLVYKLMGGGDIRLTGSGNIGAANVTRAGGPLAGVLTLLLDAGKGFLAVWLPQRFTHGNIRWMMLAAVLAILGHLFPVWLRFRGGRGVATAAGVFLLVCWKAVLVAAVVWLMVVWFWRYVSLGSISAAAALPLLMYVLYEPHYAPPTVVSVGTLLAMVLILVRHRPNILRLIAGTEARLTLRRPR